MAKANIDAIYADSRIFLFRVILHFTSCAYLKWLTVHQVAHYTKSPKNSGLESPWRTRYLSPTWNLDIKT